jgi:hypothetical protein
VLRDFLPGLMEPRWGGKLWYTRESFTLSLAIPAADGLVLASDGQLTIGRWWLWPAWLSPIKDLPLRSPEK